MSGFDASRSRECYYRHGLGLEAMQEIIDVLVSAVKEAGAEAERLLDQPELKQDKGGGDYSTTADTEAQAILCRQIRGAFPHIQIVGEEDEVHADLPSECFVLDPLDGTIMASRGSDVWGVLASYHREGTPHLGVMFLPKRNLLLVAEKGAGCWSVGRGQQGDVRLRIPERKPSDHLVLGYDFHHSTRVEDLRRYLEPLVQARALSMGAGYGSAVYAAVAVVTGVTDLYVSPYGAKVWDSSAPSLAVLEAGGEVTDIYDAPLSFHSIRSSFCLYANAEVRAQYRRILGKPAHNLPNF